MNERARTFWIPGLVALTASMGWMLILQRIISPGQAPWKHAGLPLIPHLLWLATLPLVGAASAYLSRRAGGERMSMLAASLFPSMVMLVPLLAITISLLPEIPQHTLQWANLSFTFLNWVVLPGVAMLIGSLGVSRSRTHR